MSTLFSPFALRELRLANRIVVSPMCQYSAKDGAATAWHLMHLGNLALSGAGMLCIEATAVEPEGRITAGDLGLWDDTTEAALAPVLTAIRQHSKIAVAMQIAHAGRKASSALPWHGGQLLPAAAGGWRPHAPSAVPQKEGEAPPQALPPRARTAKKSSRRPQGGGVAARRPRLVQSLLEENGRASFAVAHSRFGCACIVKRSSPPAMICSCVIALRASGLPSSVTAPMYGCASSSRSATIAKRLPFGRFSTARSRNGCARGRSPSTWRCSSCG